MKAFIALCLLFVCVYSAPTFNVELDGHWTLFKRTFEKQYETNAEETNRRLIWEENVEKIRQHNLEADLGLHTYTLGMNRYGDMTNKEFNKQMNGLDISLRNETAGNRRVYRAPLGEQLADSVDWRTKGYVTGVKDQGQCGSCWAFSTTGSLEGQHFKQTGQLVSLSEQNLVDCSQRYGNMGCNGGLMDYAFQYIKDNNGVDTEPSYPYQAQTLSCRFNPATVGAKDTGFVDVAARDEAALQSAISSVGPISVAIDASHGSFQLYRSGVYNEPACSPTQLDHGVLAVGYDSANGQDYYIVKNSWGTSWGTQGYIWMSRNKSNQCGIATMSSYPTV